RFLTVAARHQLFLRAFLKEPSPRNSVTSALFSVWACLSPPCGLASRRKKPRSPKRKRGKSPSSLTLLAPRPTFFPLALTLVQFSCGTPKLYFFRGCRFFLAIDTFAVMIIFPKG